MTARNPVEFTDKRLKRVGNQIVFSDESGNPTGNHVVIFTDNGVPILVDEITGAIAVIDTVHHEIHEGEMVVVSYKSPNASPIADDATISFLIQTKAKTAHIVIRLSFGGDCEIEIYEDTVFTGGTGTAMTVFNKNTNKATPSGYSTVRRDVTVTNVGTLKYNFFFPGGTGGNAQGISESTRDEWLLKPNTNFLIRGTNRAGNVQPGSLAIEWYEE